MSKNGTRKIKVESLESSVGDLIGFRRVLAEDGRAVVELTADQRHANVMGTLHGGILCDIADAAMGMAYATTVAEGETFTTVELKINFLKPIWSAKLSAEAHVVKSGQMVGLVECDIFDENRSLVARASSTCLTLRGKSAEGRHVRFRS